MMVSAEECLRMLQFKNCEHGELQFQNGVYKTNNPHVIDWPSAPLSIFKGTQTLETTNCFMMSTRISARYGNEVPISAAGSMTGCRFSVGSCNTREGSNSNFQPQVINEKIPFSTSSLEENPLIFRNLIIGSLSENIPTPHYNEIFEAMQGSPEALTRILSAHSNPATGPLAPNGLENLVDWWTRLKNIWQVVFYIWSLVVNLLVTFLIAVVAICGIARFYAGPWLSLLPGTRFKPRTESSNPPTPISVFTPPPTIIEFGSTDRDTPLPSKTSHLIPNPIPDCAREIRRLKTPTINVLSLEGPRYFTAQIPVRANGISCWALVDTGAGFTVASKEICALIGISRLDAPSVDHALGLGGNEVEMAGTATVKFSIGSLSVFHTTHFTSGQCTPDGSGGYDFIFGNDILQRLPKFYLDYAQGFFEMADERLPLGARKDIEIFPSSNQNPISTEDEVEIDPEFTINLSQARITDSQKEILKELLDEYHDVFSKNQYDLGSSKTDPVHIYTNTEVPIKGRPYRVPVKYQAELEKHIESLLKSRRITESNTPWTSPIVIVKKKNGSLRVCLDFRKLNEATIPDNFPLPRIDSILEKVGGSSYFSSLDMANGYLQLRLDPASSYKCGFITDQKVYAYTHLPFGLRSAASYFQRALRTVLGGLEEEVLVYIDDILVFSKTFEKHVESLRKVLHRFRSFNLKASPKKCEFAKSAITFLGHEINKDNYAPDKANVAKILEFPEPTNVNEIRRFVGMAGFFRKFIPNFSEIAEPLTRLTRKEKNFVWDRDQQESFEKLRTALIAEPILGFPDYDKPFHIFCDASSVAQGAALMQSRDEKDKDFCVIAYASRTLSDPETRWPAIQVEMGAIIYALRQFRPYVCMSKIILHSDHKPLTFLLQKAKTHDNLSRWLIELQCYDISIIHIDGKKNTVADCLSRARENDNPANHSELKDIIEFPICMKVCPALPALPKSRRSKRSQSLPLDISEEQEKDPEISLLKNVLQSKVPISSLPEPQLTRLELSTLAANGTVLTKPHSTSKKYVLYVPKHLTNLIFEAFHESYLSGGHFNWKKTKAKIGRKYYWPDMGKEIFEKSQACVKCQEKNSPVPALKEKLVPVTTSRVFQKVGLDLTGPLRTTPRNNKYILNVVCWFSKFVISVPLPDARSDTVARALLNECVLRYGAMNELVSDNATTFTSHAFGEFCDLLSIQHHKAIPYHSKGNGATERTFRTFHQLTSKYVNKDHTDWDTILPALTFCYNTTIHDSTGETPFFLINGRDPIFSIDNIIDPSPGALTDANTDEIDNFRKELVLNIREAWSHAKEQADKSRSQFTKAYDQKARPSDIEVGDRVLFKNYKSKKGLSKKLVLPWRGQYRVVQVERPEALIQDICNPAKAPQRVHLDQIKKFIEISGPAATTPREEAEIDQECQVPPPKESVSQVSRTQAEPPAEFETLETPEINTPETPEDQTTDHISEPRYNLRRTRIPTKRFEE
ncbi:hypothetical protein CRE_10000 [Caenorhabditis remanei]|uniref:RNA-directed DNA polymerase n=1 Tax=Caenorhabditis remanei TaxID=31234 RepID=E3M6Q9_CAERE|nr:hypothetical protein CRE_10000 [Caenorhabditis remanei]